MIFNLVKTIEKCILFQQLLSINLTFQLNFKLVIDFLRKQTLQTKAAEKLIQLSIPEI